MELLIKGARVIDAYEDFIGDVYVKNGVIEEIGADLIKQCEVLEGKGYILLPSFIDLHCHFRDPGLTHKEDIYTGSKAALKGGFTAVNLMANTKPTCSNREVVAYVYERAKSIGLIDIHQTVSITHNLEGTDISHLEQFSSLQDHPEDFHKNHALVKFISDDGKGVSDSKIMLQAMLKAKEKGITIISHAENPELSDIDMRLAENAMTWRDIYLAKHTGCRLHMAHVSTKEAMQYIVEAKKGNARITCEVTPHHLTLTDDLEYRVNPPFRKREDIDYLIKAIKDGFVDVIATDHAPHTVEDKQNGAPGISGLETAFPICYTALVKSGEISLNKLSSLMSEGPAKIMDLNKGRISVGYDADMVLVDVKKSYIIESSKFESKGKNTPFEGEVVYGKVISTVKGGYVKMHNERLME